MAGDELVLKKAKSHTSLGTMTAGRSAPPPSSAKKREGGLMGRVLSIVGGRKHGKSDGTGAGPFERASFIEVDESDVDDPEDDMVGSGRRSGQSNDSSRGAARQRHGDGRRRRRRHGGSGEGGDDHDADDVDIDGDDAIDKNSTDHEYNVSSDEEFKELQRKDMDLRSHIQKEIHVKELEEKEKKLVEQLRELELKEMHLKGEQLKGQLKELQIKELRFKERQLMEAREKEIEEEKEKARLKEKHLRLDKTLPEITPQRSPNPNLDKSLPEISPEPEIKKQDEPKLAADAKLSASGAITPPLSRSPLNRDKSLPKISPEKLLGEDIPKLPAATSGSKMKRKPPLGKPLFDKSLPEIKPGPGSSDSEPPAAKTLDEKKPDKDSSTAKETADNDILKGSTDAADDALLPEPRLDYITSSSSIFNRSGSGNSFNNRSLEDLPEPQIYDTPNQSYHSENTPSNDSTETLQTCASHIKFDLYQTSSRISAEFESKHEGGSTTAATSSASKNSSGSSDSKVATEKSVAPAATNGAALKTPSPSSNTSTVSIGGGGVGGVDSIYTATTDTSSTTTVQNSVPANRKSSQNAFMTSTKAQKREYRKAQIKYPSDNSRKENKSLKIKIYNKIHEDEVIALKLSKNKIDTIDFLINAVVTKAISSLSFSIDPNSIKLSIVSKKSRANSVSLTPTGGARLNAETIMDYVFSKDKIYIQAEL